MAYRIAGIDVHKRMLAVVIADVSVEGEFQFERRRVCTRPCELRAMGEWLAGEQVEEVVMESTAQYWRPVWAALERTWRRQRRQREGAGPMSGALHLAQAQSNRGPAGRKKDFPDAERLVKRLVAQELTLSFVPDDEQRLWRTVMRRKYQLTCNRTQLQNRLECLLEEAQIKLSSLVSDLLGVSARRMLQALADGETNPANLTALGDRRLRATPDQFCDALGACTDLHPVYRRLLKMTLEELRLLEQHITELDQQMASLLRANQPASFDIWVLPLEGDRKPFVYLNTNFDERRGQFSPDGRWVAYMSNESGRYEIYVRPFPGPGGQWQISTAGGIYPRWGGGGRKWNTSGRMGR